MAGKAEIVSAPPELPEALRNYYSMKSIWKVDLIQPRGSGKRHDLRKYVLPFTGAGSKLRKEYGSDYSDSKPKWWEDQFHEFYEELINQHWESTSKPNKGFRTAFHRACVSGVMRLYGFVPKPPKQIEAEKRGAERQEAEERRRDEAKREKALAEKNKREEREHKLTKLHCDLTNGNIYLADCMIQTGISLPNGNPNIEGMIEFIKECKANGKLDGRETLKEDLRQAIYEEAGV